MALHKTVRLAQQDTTVLMGPLSAHHVQQDIAVLLELPSAVLAQQDLAVLMGPPSAHLAQQDTTALTGPQSVQYARLDSSVLVVQEAASIVKETVMQILLEVLSARSVDHQQRSIPIILAVMWQVAVLSSDWKGAQRQ
jgi:hypothetical protein